MRHYAIYVADKDVSDEIKVVSLKCHSGVNQIPKLTLKLQDGDVNKGTFDLTDKDTFKLGASIQIKAGFDTNKAFIFSGIISEQSIGIDGEPFLNVIAYGDVIKLTEGPLTELFVDKKAIKDSQIISALFKERELAIDVTAIGKDVFEHSHYFVYQQTPWRAMMARVLANGWLFVPTASANKLVNLAEHSIKTHEISLKGSGLESVKIIQDIGSQFDSVNASSWNIKTQKLVEKEKKLTDILKDKIKSSPENLSFKPLLQRHATPIPEVTLETQAGAQLVYRKLDRFRGRLNFYVSADSLSKDVQLLDELDLSGLGEKYSGKYLVTGIEHIINSQGWRLSFTVGLHLNHSLFSPWLTPPAIPNLMAKVKKEAKPKPDEFDANVQHVVIELPTVSKDKTILARLLSPFATHKAGLFFPPYPDDEVVVGFVAGDCRYPIILGSTHNTINVPPVPYKDGLKKAGIYLAAKDNDFKETTAVASLSFDWSSPSLVLAVKETDGPSAEINLYGNAQGLTLDTQDKDAKPLASIAISDKLEFKKDDKNSITLADNIDIKSGGKVNIEVTDKVEIK